jgi:hypothetical protein
MLNRCVFGIDSNATTELDCNAPKTADKLDLPPASSSPTDRDLAILSVKTERFAMHDAI